MANTVRRGALQLLLVAVALIPLFPLYWLVISSVKTPNEFGQIPPTWWPENPTLEPYRQAFEAVPFARSFGNSLLIVGTCSISVLITSVLAGYAFSKYRFRGRETLFWAVVSTMFVPPIITLVPLYHMIESAGLSDKYLGVMLPWLVNAFGIFLMRQFINEIPDELLDAARADGASELQVLVRIVVPLLAPAVITLLVFTFVYYWNSFLWPLSVLQDSEKYPIVLTLNRLLSYNMAVGYQNVVLAGTLLASLPTLVLFLLSQKVFVQGIARTGIR